MPAETREPSSFFGASGDLTSRKLLPALFNLWMKGRLFQAVSGVGTIVGGFSMSVRSPRARSSSLRPKTTGSKDAYESLSRLGKLRDESVLTEEEFEESKRELLERI